MTPRRRAGLQALATVAVAALITVTVEWPAVHGRDPTGIGRATGLLALSVPQSAAKRHDGTYRSETIDIPLRYGQELEFKVAMRQGATLVYAWRVLGPHAAGPADPEVLTIGAGEPGPDRVYVDFHGHTVPPAALRVLSHRRQDACRHAQGALVAPFDGIHGWYWLNDSQGPVVLRLQLAGFYERQPASTVP